MNHVHYEEKNATCACCFASVYVQEDCFGRCVHETSLLLYVKKINVSFSSSYKRCLYEFCFGLSSFKCFGVWKKIKATLLVC